MNIRKHIQFYGRVQGVGFRYHATYKARFLGLTGWVSNLPDGRVEMEVQGETGAIEKLLELLNEDMYIRISKTESMELPIKEKEKKFRTQY